MGQGYDHMWGGGFLLAGGPLLWIIAGIPFAIGLYHVAGRLGRSQPLWAVLSLVPFVNYFFWIYAAFVIVLAVLDRLNALTGAGGRS